MIRRPGPPLRSASVALAITALAASFVVGGAGLLGAGPFAGLAGTAGSPTSPGASAGTSTVGALVSPAPSIAPAPSPTPAPTPTPTPLPPVAVVPVAGFRSAATGTDGAEVAAVLGGTGQRWKALVVVAAEAPAVLAALELAAPADPSRLLAVPDAETLRADLAAHPDHLGVLRASGVDASIRALTWGHQALFGVGRVTSLGEWPLQARLAPAATAVAPEGAYDPAAAWTVYAGGDLFLDRGVYLAEVVNGKGADFLFDGGTVEITGHTCCSSFGWPLPVTRSTGNAGLVRSLVRTADLALANFENPAPLKWTWHQSGTVFSANPALIAGIANAGVDWVSLANNHIGDAGANGILETMTALDGFGIAHAGAGRGAAAHAASFFTVKGVRVAVLGFDAIASYYWQTTAAGVGSAGLTGAALQADIAAARTAGAQLVIVYPHWGVEYTAAPTATQRQLAHAAIDAGADLVIGNHPHWAGAMEVYNGKPIWYALGNWNFDQNWSGPTMEGITLELTFSGTRLVQAALRPHLILGHGQPNLLDPAGSGAVVMRQVFDASKGLLPW